MTPLQVLKKARTRVTGNKYHWIQGKYKGKWNDEMQKCHITSRDDADCFCAVGAMQHATEYQADNGYYPAMTLLSRAVRQLHPRQAPYSYGSELVVSFNDNPVTRHEDVVAVFDLAIELAKEEG